MQLVESIEWKRVKDGLPDDELTVMTFSPLCDEPVWLGYRDGDVWRYVDAMPVNDVSHWAHLPNGPREYENS